jgi:hypothetical protein
MREMNFVISDSNSDDDKEVDLNVNHDDDHM